MKNTKISSLIILLILCTSIMACGSEATPNSAPHSWESTSSQENSTSEASDEASDEANDGASDEASDKPENQMPSQDRDQSATTYTSTSQPASPLTPPSSLLENEDLDITASYSNDGNMLECRVSNKSEESILIYITSFYINGIAIQTPTVGNSHFEVPAGGVQNAPIQLLPRMKGLTTENGQNILTGTVSRIDGVIQAYRESDNSLITASGFTLNTTGENYKGSSVYIPEATDQLTFENDYIQAYSGAIEFRKTSNGHMTTTPEVLLINKTDQWICLLFDEVATIHTTQSDCKSNSEVPIQSTQFLAPYSVNRAIFTIDAEDITSEEELTSIDIPLTGTTIDQFSKNPETPEVLFLDTISWP